MQRITIYRCANIFLVILALLMTSCDQENSPSQYADIDFREEMRTFVIDISQYAKSHNPDFVVIPQNGIELVTQDGEETGTPATAYLAAIDGNGQEDLFYGYEEDDRPTPVRENEYLRAFLNVSRDAGNTILVTDYCSTPSRMDDSYSKNSSAGYISFAADQRELDNIPEYPEPIHSINDATITTLSEAQNFLYLLNPGNFASKTEFIDAVTATDYDLVIMDLFFDEATEFEANDVAMLRSKSNGGNRLVVAYMSIGEAEDYRYYWQSDWTRDKPSWLAAENPAWEGNYKVRYWDPEWQGIIYGDENSYLKKILDAGFDGVYLDIIDAFEYFE